MKKNKRQKRGLLLMAVLLTLLGVAALNGEVMAQTQGDVAMQLAAILGLNASSPDNAIAALTGKGVVPVGGWSSNAPVGQSFVCPFYGALNGAITAGAISPSKDLNNASALAAAAATAAGLSSSTFVNEVVSCGGDREQASAGASYASSLAGSLGPGAGTGRSTGVSFGSAYGIGAQAGGGGGGGITSSVSSPSR